MTDPQAYLEDWHVRERHYTQRSKRGLERGYGHDARERICLNFDPDRVPKFVDGAHRQETLLVGEVRGKDGGPE